jgi:hypothetical protein
MGNGLRNRRIGVAAAALLLMILAFRHPSADIHIITHTPTDLSPHQVQAAVDFGLMSISFLYTWTAGHSAS